MLEKAYIKYACKEKAENIVEKMTTMLVMITQTGKVQQKATGVNFLVQISPPEFQFSRRAKPGIKSIRHAFVCPTHRVMSSFCHIDPGYLALGCHPLVAFTAKSSRNRYSREEVTAAHTANTLHA